VPVLPGAGDFAGQVLLTAQWPEEDVDLRGKRVGVIGTGSSGIQSVPVIAESAADVVVFQRSANYSVPALNRPHTPEDQERIRAEYPARRAVTRVSSSGSPYESYPRRAHEVDDEERRAAFEARWQEGGVQFAKTFPDQTVDVSVNDLAREFAEAKIRSIVRDPQVAEDLIPRDHPIGTKRICTDSGYYSAFNRPNVRLVNLRREPITTLTAGGVTTTRTTYELDVLVYATGFDAMTGAVTRIDLRGRRGARITSTWFGGPLTYLGLGVPGFPNLFTLTGPGSPSVLANMILAAEQQVEWLVDLLLHCRDTGVVEVEARRDAAQTWTRHVDEAAAATLFPRAASWYVGANVDGKQRVFMPYIGGFGRYRGTCDQVAANGYEGFVLTSR
jgi:cation diffusion facilitator CzcD-associated flavoprotein CzcO